MTRIISADSHVVVQPEDVKARLATKHHAAYDNAQEQYRAHLAELFGSAGKVDSPPWEHAAWGRPGNADSAARLADMDADGVDVEVLYSELSAFRSFHLMDSGGIEAARAFNDCLSDFAAADPKRLIVNHQLPLYDLDASVAEVERLADLGSRTVQLPLFPHEVGAADYHSPDYARLFGLLSETGMPVSQHLGPKLGWADLKRRDPTRWRSIYNSLHQVMMMEPLAMWIMTGVLERFPSLRIVFVEPELAWIPWFCDHMDKFSIGLFDVGLPEKPSYYFHRQVWVTFMDDLRGLGMRHDIGVDRIMWSTDYPHPAGTWPDSRKIIEEQFAGIPDEEREAITCGNAAALYGL